MDFNQIMALKQLVAQEQEPQIVENHYKGSMLNPGNIGEDSQKKQMAKPRAKVQAKMGEKYVPKNKKQQPIQKQISKPKKDPKHQIWSQDEVKQLPVSLQDPRPQPNFEVLYRQKVGTEDVFLGLSGVDPSSNYCQEMLYKIQLPDTNLKQIQLDLNQKQMVLQTNKFYLAQYFQYKIDGKNAKAEFVSDKNILKLILPVIKELF